MNRKCSTCLSDKPLSEFHKNCRTKDGYVAECKACKKVRAKKWYDINPSKRKEVSKNWKTINKERCKVTSKAWWQKNKHKAKKKTTEYNHKYALNKFYKMTPEQYDEMLVKQGGVCAICNCKETAKTKNTVRNLSVDHCHTTNKIRSLLCYRCNLGIGYLREDLDILQAAIEYIRRHSA